MSNHTIKMAQVAIEINCNGLHYVVGIENLLPQIKIME